MALSNAEKQAAFRLRNAALGRTELRGIYATDEEQVRLKKLIREDLKNTRYFGGDRNKKIRTSKGFKGG